MKHIFKFFRMTLRFLAGWCLMGAVSAQEAVNLPFSSDFSTNTAWTLLNEDGKNGWVIGEDANTKNDGGACLFISPNGTKFGYDSPTTIQGVTSVAYAYFKVNIPSGQSTVLTFRYFVSGDADERYNGYVEAGLYVGCFAAAPTAGTDNMVEATDYMDKYVERTSYYADPALWQEAAISIDGAQYSGDQYIVFAWYNHEDANKYGTFAAIDDVELKVDDCPAPSALTVGEVTAHSIAYSWTPADGIGTDDLADYTYQIQQKVGTDDWADVTPAPAVSANNYTLSNLTENTSYGFRIRGYRSETSYSRWITAPATTTPYACPAPTGLAVTESADGDYVFTWSSDIGKYILEYRRANASEWTATAELTDATYTLASGGLAPSTNYEARVRGVCAAGDAPNYTASVTFKTPCGVVNLPYVEDFETWESDNSLSCWMLLDKDGNARSWNVKNTFSSYDDRTGACVKFNYNSKTGDRLVSPALNITAVSALSFLTKGPSYGSAPYNVLISESDTKPESFTALLPTLTAVNAWVEQKILLGETYVGKTVYIAIEAQSTSDLYIDDFSVKPYPAPFVTVATATTSATLTLSPAAPAYTVRYRLAGATDWTTLTDQTSPLTLSDLVSGKTYEVQAQAHYAGDHTSEWSETLSFGTCVELPYVQDFSAVEVGQIPADWNQTTGTAWQVAENEGEKSLRLSSASATVECPTFSLADVDFDRLELIFTYTQQAYSSYVNVSISTDGGSTWEALTGYGKPLGTLSYASSAGSVVKDTKTLALGELVGEATSLMVRFEGTYSYSSFTFNLYDIRVQEHPRCLPPADLRVVAETQTPTSVELTWTEPSEIAPTAYQFSYALTEADLETATVEELPADPLSKTLENLQPNHTLYYVRMRSVCGEEGQSDAAAAVSFYTLYTCRKVNDLHLTKLTDASAEFAFTYAQDVNYEVEYKTASAEAWTALSAALNQTSFALSSLQADTRYMVRLRAICAADDPSLWDTLAFKTPCALQALPMCEGFEQPFTEWAPACWQYVRLSGATSILQWERSETWALKGDASLRHPGNTGGTAVMVSPYLDFETDAYYNLSFYLRREGYESGKTDGLGVWFNTAPVLEGGREIAFLVNHEDDETYPSEEAFGTIGERWRLFTFDSLKGLEAGYLLFYVKGDENQSNPFYVDEINVSKIYPTNIALQSVNPIPARANMGEETVSVILNNAGEKDYRGEVRLTYQVNALPAVSETVAFTEEKPLTPGTPYTHTFATKADLSAKGQYTITATVEADGDPMPEDNTAATTTVSYQALTLPFETDFSPESAGAVYLHTVNADNDGYEWILPPEQPQAMIYGRNSGALDDYLYTPGLKLAVGAYEIELTYAARQETYRERLSVEAYTHFTAKDAGLSILWDTTSATERKTCRGRLEIETEGIYMIGIHAESAESRGINVYDLSVKAVQEPEEEPEPEPEPEEKPVVEKALSETICAGETYHFGNRELTEAGLYNDTVRAAEADTIFKLTLTVLSKPEPPVVRREDAGQTVVLVAETPEEQVQWYNADGLIYGAEEARFTVTENGIYHATAIGVCGESEASNAITVTLTGNERLTALGAPMVYPNPARTDVVIRVGEGQLQAVRIISVAGREVWRATDLHTSETVVSVRALEKGMYLLMMETDNGVFTGKLQVVR